MKKLIKPILALPFIISALLSNAQTYLSENFEHGGSSPSGWTEEYVSGTASWTYKEGGLFTGGENHPDTAYSGDYNAAFIYSTSYTTKLVSPSIDLEEALKPALIFGHAMQKYGSDIDELYVYFKNGIDSTWMLLKEYTVEVPIWTERTIYLPDSILTSDCYVAFEAVSKFGAGVCVDSVQVVEKGYIPKRINEITINNVTNNFIPTNSSANQILQLNFEVIGNNGNVILDSIAVKSLNTSDDDISSNGVKLYFTEDTVFNTTTEIGATNFTDGIAVFDNLQQILPYDWSSVWVCYDIGLDSTHKMHNHIADAMIEADAIKIGSYTYPFASKSPEGNRTIYESIFIDGFEENKGWIFTGEFERNKPQGLGATGFYNPDPEQAYEGDTIIGTDLIGRNANLGDYEPSISSRANSATSPAFNAQYFKDVSLVFHKMLNLDNKDSAYIELSDDNGSTWEFLWKSSGYYNDRVWKESNFDVSSVLDDKEFGKIRFTLGPTDASYQAGGWNVDNIIFVGDYISNDVGVTSWLAPLDGCGHTDNEHVELTITNFAGDTLKDPLPITFTIDGSTLYKDTIETTNIAPGESLNYTITDKPVDLTNPGWYNNAYATTNLSTDEISSNNKLTKKLFIAPTYNLPYSESFENNDGYFKSGGTYSTWQYGVPSGVLIDNAYSGTKSWVTSLNGWYEEYESSYIESPCFDFTGSDSVIFEFACFGESEDQVDGLAVMYSFDEGQSWNFLPNDHDYYWNWYNETNISELGGPGIDETNGSWLIMRQLLPNNFSNQNSVKFRFVLESDYTVTLEGFAIDDVKVYEAPADVGVSAIVEPYTACEWSDETQVKVTVENFGITTLEAGSKIPVGLDFQGSYFTTDTLELVSPLAPEGTVEFTFTETIDMSTAGDYDITAYTLLESDPYFYNETICNDSTSETVTVQGMPNYNPFPVFIGVDAGSPISELLDAGAGYDNYSWSTAESTQTITATAVGTYSVEVTKNASPVNCTATDTVEIIGSTTDITVNSIVTDLADSCELTERTQLTELTINITNNGLADLTNADDTIFLAYQINELPMVEDTLADPGLVQTASTDFTFSTKCDLRSADEYTIKVFHNFPQDLNPEDDTVNTTINTWAYPYVNLAYDTIYSSQADTLTLDAGVGFASYLWTPGDSTTQTITPTNSSYYYKVTVTDVNGCGSNSDSTYIETHDIGISNITSPVDICYDDVSGSVNLNVEITNYSDSVYTSSSQTIYYEYDEGVPVEVNPSISVGASGVTLVNIGSVDVNSIKEHILKVYTSSDIDVNHSNDTIKYTFNTWPEPDVDLAFDTIFTTRPDTVILVAQEGFSSYNWSDGITTNDTLEVSDMTTENYIVTVTSPYGCGEDKDSTQIIAYNFGVTELLGPKSKCEHSSSETIKISVKNYSQDIITSGTVVPVGYIINNNSPVKEVITLGSDLDPGKTITYSFTEKADLSNVNSYSFKLFTAFDLDAKTSNDTLIDVIKTFGYPSIELGDDILTTNPTSVVLSAPSGYNTYLWNNDSTTQSIDVIYPASSLYSVTVTDINGCTATDNINVYTYNVAPSDLISPVSQCELSNSETVSFDIINNSLDTLLENDVINVSYILNSGSPVNESFSLADSLKPGGTVSYTFTQTADLSNNQTHQLDLYAELASIDVETNDNILRNVDYQTPIFDLGASVTTGGTEYTIDAGSGYTDYLWFDGSSQQTYTVDINDQRDDNLYSVTVTNSYGCEASDSKEVIFTTTPDLSVTDLFSPTVSKCWNQSEEDSVHIEITNVGVVNVPSGTSFTVGYVINEGSPVTETFNLSAPMNANDTRDYVFTKFTYSSAGYYKFKPFVKLSDDGNVNNDTLTTTNTIEISQPEVDFVGQSDSVYISSGESYTIQINGSYLEYSWDYNNATTSTIEVSDEDAYSVTVTDQYNCSAEGTFYVFINTGIDNMIKGDGYSLTYYPNPATDKVLVQFDNSKPTDVVIEIVSINGQIIFNSSLKDIENYLERIDVNSYANGIYYLRFRINKNIYTRKLIIQ